MNIVAYQNTTNIVTGVTVACLVVFILSAVIGLNTNNRRTAEFMRITRIIVCLALFIGGCILFYRSSALDKARADANYTVYLDGEKVDKDKVDVTLYRRSYNDEKKEVYITRGGRR